MPGRRLTLEDAQKLEKKGDLAGAVGAYADHLAATPKDSRAQLRVAELKERLGEALPAAEAFAKLADLHLADGMASKAVAALRQAARLAPHDVALALRLAQQLMDVKRKGDALAVLRAAEQDAVSRADLEGRLAILRLRSQVDEGARASVALADALVEAGKPKEALARLRKLALALSADTDALEQLELYEKIAKLSPEDADSAKGAARVALKLSQGRRALTSLRASLDHHPEDPELFALSAAGLESMGERARALMVYREAARSFSAGQRTVDAQEQWLSVLRLDASDQEARTAVAPPLVPDVAQLLTQSPPKLREITQDEALDALAMLDRTPAPPSQPSATPAEWVLEIEPEELTAPLTLVGDAAREPPYSPEPNAMDVVFAQAGPQAALSALEVTRNVSQPPTLETPLDLSVAGLPATLEERARLEQLLAPPPPGAAPVPVDAGPQAAPMPARALVMLSGPEAAVALTSLAQLGVGATLCPPADEEGAVELARSSKCDLIVAPQGLAPAWRQSGSWLVVGPVTLPRRRARSLIQSAGLPALESMVAGTLGELESALARWGAPLELVGEVGGPVRIASGGSPLYHLGLARERLGSELLAQPAPQVRTRVLVASSGRQGIALASWTVALREGTKVFESPAPDEAALLVLAGAMAQVLNLGGLGVLTLARHRDTWALDGMEPTWGPAGLAVEARLGTSLLKLSLDLARGAPLPALQREGHAFAAVLPVAPPQAAGLRVERSPDGYGCFICSHAAQEVDAAARLSARAEKGDRLL